MKTCLYLSTFDPTGSTSGTAARGKLFLRAFSHAFRTHLVHLDEKHAAGIDASLVAGLASARAIDYSPLEYFLFSRPLYRAAASVLASESVDFIFADFEKAGLYARLLSRRFGVPYVYSSHNVEYLRYLDFARRQPWRYALVPWVWLAERVGCRGSLFTISISGKDATSLRAWLPPERLSVLPCAFDELQIHPDYDDTPDAPPAVLLVGNYRNAGNRAGAEYVFRSVLPRVLEKHPRAIFRFVGKDLPAEIRHPNVERLDFVDDLLEQYRRASVVLAPITIGGGIKIKVIEALAAGRLLVATEKAMEGIPEQGLENLAVVPLERFAETVDRALDALPQRTVHNFPLLRHGFGCHTQLAELVARIDGALDRRG